MTTIAALKFQFKDRENIIYLTEFSVIDQNGHKYNISVKEAEKLRGAQNYVVGVLEKALNENPHRMYTDAYLTEEGLYLVFKDQELYDEQEAIEVFKDSRAILEMCSNMAEDSFI